MVPHERAVTLVSSLPETVEATSYGNRAWKVGGNAFAWDRPFSKADLRRFGDEPVPGGPIMAIRTDDLEDKQAILDAGLPGVFTIPHFDGYAAVLVQLDVVGEPDPRELVVDGWLSCAPAALGAEFLADRDG